MEPHPVHLFVAEDLRRSRLTVAFRFLLVIPHVIVLALWGLVMVPVAVVNWLAALFTGSVPAGLHSFTARFLRYVTHVTGYLFLLADPYPPFGGGEPYAVDLQVPPPERQNRWKIAFRAILAIPAFFLASVLGQVLQVIAFLAWFVCLAVGRMPGGMQNLGAYCLRYGQQTYAYLLLLTERYPSLAGEPGAAPERASSAPLG